MSKTNLAKDIMKEILDIFSLLIEKMKRKSLSFGLANINKIKIKNKFREISFKKRVKVTLETDIFYQYLIKKIYEYLPIKKEIYFNSLYSVLYFSRIINYLQMLIKSDINVVEDKIVKIFFYLLFMLFDENLSLIENKNKSSLFINLDEAFFKGTFIELTKIYSSKVPYKDTEKITALINNFKNQMKVNLLILIDNTFQFIKEILEENVQNTDEIINKMKNDANDILFELSKSGNDLSDALLEKIKSFYSKKENLIFTYYISEYKEDLGNGINSEFLKNIEKKYSPFTFYDFSEINLSEIADHKDKYKQYIDKKNNYYNRMKFSSLSEIFKLNLNDELIILALAEYDIPTDFEKFQKLIFNLGNLKQDKITTIINEILNKDDFYNSYFSILKTDIIKNFFTSHLYIDENGKDFQLKNEESKYSECFSNIYFNFIKEYDKKDENYKEFKDLIILKILTIGDRAYTDGCLKKILINPAMFFLGKDINGEEELKTILKGYLLVILLLETENYFLLLDKDNKIFDLKTRKKKGGALFIKYLFGVDSISHINLNQANIILKSDNWKEHAILKNIFIDQFEDFEGENDFILKCFPNSISFFTMRQKEQKNNSKFNILQYIKKYN